MGDSLRLTQSQQVPFNADGFVGNLSPDFSAQIATNVILDPDAQALLADQVNGLINDQVVQIVRSELPSTILVDPQVIQDALDAALATTPVGEFGPPDPPSAPTVSGTPGGLLVVWNGRNADSTMFRAPSYSHVDVHVSTDAVAGLTFTPDATTRKGTILATPGQGGQAVVPSQQYGVTHYVRLVAVSLSGEQSTPSTGASGQPLQISTLDVGAFALTVLNFIDDKHHLY